METHFIAYMPHDCVLVLGKTQHPFLGQYGVGRNRKGEASGIGKERLQCQKAASGGLNLLSQLCS